jgi:pyruvate,water dikinase
MYALSQDRPPWRLSAARLPALVLGGSLVYLTIAVLLARMRALPDGALDGYRALCRAVEGDEAIGPEAALRRLWLLPRILDPIANMPLFVNLGCGQGFLWMGVLRRLVRRWAPDLRADAEGLLSSGSEGVLSAEMGRGISMLATEARSHPVRDILVREAPTEMLAKLRQEPAARAFLGHLDAFLATNGHRGVKEFELRSVRWEEDPSAVLGMVRNYLLIEGDPLAHETKAAEARAGVVRELRERLDRLRLERAFGFRYRLIEAVAGRWRYFLKLRENSRFYHIMGLATVRKKILRAETELLREGKLKCKDDVFFLLFSEIQALRDGSLGWPDVEDRIRERRIEHIRLCKMGPPKTIGFELPRPPAAEAGPGGLLLRGQSASTGRYEGTARVILDPSIDAELLPGEVLVAPYTDPAWTPLFLTAGAAVVEVGSYLSHAGTVAREFGMPCVVDVAEATVRIRTGDRVAVDGHAGSVRIVGRGAEA